MLLKYLLEMFCIDNSDNYEYREDYSGRCMFGKTCPAVVVKNGISQVEMWMELSKYIYENGFEDEKCELLNPACDSMGKDIIVYFPHAHGVRHLTLDEAYEILSEYSHKRFDGDGALKIEDFSEEERNIREHLKRIYDTRVLSMPDCTFLFNLLKNDTDEDFGEAVVKIVADALNKME